jgi:replication factor A1
MPTEMAVRLSNGSVGRIYKTRDTTDKPVVQVVEVKRLNPPADVGASSRGERYRLAVSDGAHYMQAMLATQLNHLVTESKVESNTIVRLNDYIVQEVTGKCIIIILNLDVLRAEDARVGVPVNADSLMQDAAASLAGSGAAVATSSGDVDTGDRVNVATRPTSSGIMSMAGPRSGSGSGLGGAPLYRDIATINPYHPVWTIKGRCTFKSDLRTFQNARGEGQVISFELTDKSGSIRITAFSDKAADVVANVRNGGIYAVSKAQLKPANAKYNRSTSNYEMTLSANSVLRAEDDDGTVAPIRYKFTKVADLEQIEVKAGCDVVAVVHDISEVTEIVIRSTGEPCMKRSLTLVDASNASVELTLWREQAETLVTEADRDRHPVLVLRNASRGDFGGVCLNTNRATVIERDPPGVSEVAALRAWYDAGGASSAALQSLSSRPGSAAGGQVLGDRRSLDEVRESDIASGGLNSGGMVQFVMRGYVVFVKKDKDLSYPSDPGTKKKVTESDEPGVWHSESSGRDFTDDEIVHRYVCQLKIADFSGAQWMGSFDEGGQVVFGRSAGEMRTLRATDEALYGAVVDDALFQPLVLKVQVKEDSYNGETRIRYTVSRAERTDIVRESRALLTEIAAYGIGGKS